MRPNGTRPWVGRVLTTMMVGCLGTTALAEEPRPFWEAPADASVAVKQVTGELSLIRPGSISLVYRRDEQRAMDYEMVFPIGKGVALLRRRALSELQVGDTVRVTYEERAWKEEATGVERMQRRATTIEFLRSAQAGLRSG